jgi:RHH-type transcriptional regulator, proline utilization regulon repressor / proline dehydrogenase / delta 1-pyrroline-5-carboxylate dehydrogenase
MKRDADLEEKVKKVGGEIFSLIGADVPAVFDRKHWTGKIMDWCMQDEGTKVQLFRFVDVLPTLTSNELVARLLGEYFADVEHTPLIRGIGFLSATGLLPHLVGKLIRSNLESLARQFIAGRDPADALPVLESFRKEGCAVSVDLLGEEVLSQQEAARYTERYRTLLHFLGPKAQAWPPAPILDSEPSGPIPRLDVSLKISSFYSQLNPVDWDGSIENAAAALKPVLDAALDVRVSLTFDMEFYYWKDLTLAVFLRTLEQNPALRFVGIALQAYLKDARKDLLRIVEWAKSHKRRVTVRLVKGAYWDYETVINTQRGWPVPVFSQKAETDLNYEELTRILVQNTEYVRPAIATHNIRSISHAIAVARQFGLPRDAIEFQTIYGMAEPVRNALTQLGFRTRIYSPIGELIPGMAYLIRRLLENTSNESFLRKSFAESESVEELTQAPRPVKNTVRPDNRGSEFANEPETDFSKAENREAMKRGLKAVKNQLNKRYPLVVGRSEIWTDNEIWSVNPARPSEVVGRQCGAGEEHAEEAVKEARKAWRTWKDTPCQQRAQYLFSAAIAMRADRFRLAALEVYEVGKTWQEADGDVAEAIDFLNYYGSEMMRMGAAKILGNYPGEENVYIYEPRGVGAVIAPWNFPLAIATGMVAAGLVTGNCVIFKPSSLSPILGWRLFEIFREAGLPAGVLQFLPGSGAGIGEQLVSHPGIDFVAFTGSKEVGLRLVRLAAETPTGQRNVKRVIAEMGGKNAIIVDETADIDAAVKGVLDSALSFQGQKCSACSRVIVVGAGFEEFCARLREAMESVSVGPPDEPGSVMGPVVDEGAVRRIQHYLELASREGQVVLAKKVDGDGYFVGPAIITQVSPSSAIAQEELFGPVVVVMQAEHIDAALDMANGTPFALTGGLFSRSPANIRKVQSEFRVGNLYINRKITGALVGRQPFGGFGMSGIGSKAGGPDYLLQFMHARTLTENTLRRGFAPMRRST